MRRSTGQRLVIASGALLAVCLFLGAGAFAFVSSKLNSFDRVDVNLDNASGGPENYLLVGSDSRASISAEESDAGAFLEGDTAGRRSDTIMVARVDPKVRQVALLSIPRDLWVPIAGTGGTDRINSAYAVGPQALVDTITSVLGIPINHYVEVDFAGFKGLVDVLGGVPMYIDQPMRDEWTGLDIEDPGCVVLKGDQALAFARSRHLEVYDGGEWVTDPTSDLGRMTRQQVFLRRAMDKAKGLGLTDLLKVNKLVDVAADNVSFDPGLSVTRAVSLIRRFGATGSDALATFSLPTTPFTTDGGAEVLSLQQAEAQPTLDIFRGTAPMPGTGPAGGAAPAPADGGHGVQPSAVSVTVLNGTGVDGQANEAADGLRAAGFTVAKVGDAGTSDQTRTAVRYASGARAGAELVAASLKGTVLLSEDDSIESGVVLVTGADFAGVAGPPSAPSTTGATTTQPSSEGAAAPTDGTVPATTPTTAAPIGFAPGDPPPGVSCG
jgi:LCP family protein required for cell wall assembly